MGKSREYRRRKPEIKLKSDKKYLDELNIPFDLNKVKQGHWIRAIVTIPDYITEGKWYINGSFNSNNYDVSRNNKENGFWIGNPDDGSFYPVPRDEYWQFDLQHVMPFNPKNKKHILFFTNPIIDEEIFSNTDGGVMDFFKKELKNKVLFF